VPDDIAKNVKLAADDLELGRIAAQLQGESRARSTKAAVLRLVLFRRRIEQQLVGGAGEIVGPLRQRALDRRIAVGRLAHREIRHRVVAEQHHLFALRVPHRRVGRAAALKQQGE